MKFWTTYVILYNIHYVCRLKLRICHYICLYVIIYMLCTWGPEGITMTFACLLLLLSGDWGGG